MHTGVPGGGAREALDRDSDDGKTSEDLQRKKSDEKNLKDRERRTQKKVAEHDPSQAADVDNLLMGPTKHFLSAESGSAINSGGKDLSSSRTTDDRAAKRGKTREEDADESRKILTGDKCKIPDDSELKNLTHAILGDEDDLQKQSVCSKVLRKVAEKIGLRVLSHHLQSPPSSSCSVTWSKSSNSCY